MPLIKDTWAASLNPILVELFYSGAWQDITADVSDEGLSITRGRGEDGQRVDPSEMTLSLKNTTGKYSPRNPNSPLYGLIGRNTPIRASVLYGANLILLDGATANLTAPDSVNTSIVGDLELQWDGALEDWTATTDLLSKYGAAGQRSYALQVQPNGTVALYWSADGTTLLSAVSTVSLPTSTKRVALKVTLDVDNGAAGRTVAFYTADTSSGPWVAFGDPVVQAGVTSIFDSTSPTTLGKNTNTTAAATVARIFEARVLQGIGGTLRAVTTATSLTAGAASFADGQGNTWTVNAGASITNQHRRFWGEVTEWPQKWTKRGAGYGGVYASIVCSGVTRRLGQGASPVRSTLYRGTVSLGSNLVAYWPCEDVAGSTNLRPAKTTRVGRISGVPKLAAYSGLASSAPLPTLQAGRLLFDVDPYTNTNEFQVRHVVSFPTAGTIPNGTILARVYTNNSLGWIDVFYNTGGALGIQPYTNAGVATASNFAAFGVNGKTIQLSLECKKNGTGIDFTLATVEPGAAIGGSIALNVAGATLGSCTRVELNPGSAAIGDTAVGHVTVEKLITSLFALGPQLGAWAGETAAARIARLSTENGLTTTVLGDGGGSVYLGAQAITDVVTLLQDAAAADYGILYEPRTSLGLAYRTVEAMYSQRAAAAIAYSGNLLLPFEPVDDDQRSRNRVTVTRSGGSSATVEDATSAMGTAAPPTGIGVYDESVTMSLYRDEQAKHQAGWRVRVGTTNEARWPRIGIDLAHPTIKANATLGRSLMLLDLGDRICVTSLPSWLPPDAVSQLVQGYTETITPGHYKIVANCVPASPYRAARYSATTDRYSNDASTLAATMTTTATSVTVNVPSGPLWTTTAGDFPFDVLVAGERMTVTNITGAATPQTFTVTRSVNAVVKAQAIGATVALADPVYFGL